MKKQEATNFFFPQFFLDDSCQELIEWGYLGGFLTLSPCQESFSPSEEALS